MTRRVSESIPKFCIFVPRIITNDPPPTIPPAAPSDFIRVDTCDTRRCTPSCATARGHRAVVPPGHGGRGVPLTYRALAPAGAGIRSGTLTVSSYILHSTFYILHWTYTFSAKERDAETGLSYFGARYYSSDLSIWLSVDPMSDKYPSLSPYSYCANNPVKLVDPNGDAYIPIGDEEAKAEAVAQIQNKTNLNVYIDKDGFLRAEGKAKTKIDKFLQSSCNNDKVQVELDCRNDNLFSWSDGSIRGTENGGGYDGNFYDGDCVVARQCICPTKLEEYDKSMGDSKAGLTMIHEMAEGYFGGKIAMRKKKSSPMAGVTGSTYNRAHRMATRIAWGNRGDVYREDDIRYNPATNKIEKGPFKTLIGYERKP